MSADVRALADEVHGRWLAAQPFLATVLGVPGYDAQVTDLSRAAEDSLAAAMTGLRAQAGAVDATRLGPADQITHAAVLDRIDGLLTTTGIRAVEYSLSTLGEGPSALIVLAAQSRLTSAGQAADHLARVRGYPGYLATQVERLREGAAAGRLPVATLVRVALAQVAGYLDGPGPDVLAGVAAPAGWEGAQAWANELRALVGDEVRPALKRWYDAVAALPTRSDDHCGLVHLPGGAADYERLVSMHTTLPLTARQVHELGQECVADLVARMTELGGRLGLRGFAAVRDAVRDSGVGARAEPAMARARDAVRRAEAALAGSFDEPLPPPCEVTAMSEHLARAGMPPHYTPARPDGRPGTYWFNADQPGAGCGWDLETTAFHEAVPGHHLQVSRSLGLRHVPALQAQGLVTAYEEGWALYAEVLAGELGLYTSVEMELGALSAQVFRAARLVVDTGIHALGWSRDRALEWLPETVPCGLPFLEAEVNRYIGLPGQALGYLVGQRELLRLRQDARNRLGERFSLVGFHRAVLDSGTLPLPAVGAAVEAWIAAVSTS